MSAVCDALRVNRAGYYAGWDGDEKIQSYRYANSDDSSGRMVELIESRYPAVMLCHWHGLYSHGSQEGFQEFKKVVTAIDTRFSKQINWMRLSEIGRNWAARKLTKLNVEEDLAVVLDLFTEDECRNYLRHCGYRYT